MLSFAAFMATTIKFDVYVHAQFLMLKITKFCTHFFKTTKLWLNLSTFRALPLTLKHFPTLFLGRRPPPPANENNFCQSLFPSPLPVVPTNSTVTFSTTFPELPFRWRTVCWIIISVDPARLSRGRVIFFLLRYSKRRQRQKSSCRHKWEEKPVP